MMPKTHAFWPDGYARCVLDVVDSTLDEARRRQGSFAGPEWIMARVQTAARGRQGRAWSHPEGNFAATLILCPSEPPYIAAQRSFVTALALHKALSEAIGSPEALALKWPNDVLLNGGKVAGILLESAGQGGSVNQMAIGIGVNLISAPDLPDRALDAPSPVAVASEIGMVVEQEIFLDLLAAAYAAYETQFVTYGFAPIRAAWLDRAAKLGEVITARTARDTFSGTFADVDEAGQLVLDTAKGRQTIPAADVFF